MEDGTIRYAMAGGPFNCTSGGDISGNRVSVRGRSGYVYYYGHLDQILVETDEEVVKGQIIGTLGRTGNAACSSAHLHFEVSVVRMATPSTRSHGWRRGGRRWRRRRRGRARRDRARASPSPGSQRADLFTLECSQSIRHRVWTPWLGIQGTWNTLAGVATSDPDVASPGAGGFPQVYVRGTDNGVYQYYWSGSQWATHGLGGNCASGPTAAFSGPMWLEVFCRGTDNAIYQTIWDGGHGWSKGWARIGGLGTSDPDAASPGPGYPAQVYVRGADQAIYQMYWTGSRWEVVNLGGQCTSGPSATFSGPARADVFCRGTDLALWHRWWIRGHRMGAILAAHREQGAVRPRCHLDGRRRPAAGVRPRQRPSSVPVVLDGVDRVGPPELGADVTRSA